MPLIDVRGHCPACGNASLHLTSDSGILRCLSPTCPRPAAADELLAVSHITDHLVTVNGNGGWTVRHPLIERIEDALFECPLTEALSDGDLGEDRFGGVWWVRYIPGPGAYWEWEAR